MNNKNFNSIKIIIVGIIALVVLMFSVSILPFTIIGAGQRGVIIRLGKVQPYVLNEGFHIITPFVDRVQKISVRVQKSDVKTSGASKDLQDVGLELVVNWHINSKKANNVYQQIGDETAVLENIIAPAVSEMAKAATAKKTAEEIITKRQELKADIDKLLVSRLDNYGVFLNDVSIVDIKFSDEFNRAIEAKQVAEQEAKQAIFRADQAKNDAIARVNKAEGEAKAQQLQVQSLTPELLQKIALDKWNGVLPIYTGGSPIPFLNIK